MEVTKHPSKEVLQVSLKNLQIVISEYRITNGEVPLTGKQFAQLFQDLKNLNDLINSLE